MRAMHWQGDLLLFGGSVIGTIERDVFDRGWWAHGCRDNWQDVALRLHPTPAKARAAVKAWAVGIVDSN